MDDKKKMIVVVSLVVVILAVGAFQLTGGGSSSAPATQAAEKKPAKKDDAGKAPTEPKNAEVATPLAMRDPFSPSPLPGSVDTTPTPDPTPRPPTRSLPEGVPPIDLTGVGQLPGAQIGIQPAGTGEPVKEDVFGYSLVGVVVGDHSAALFADGAGNQKLVREGSSIDGDARLISIAHGRVTVSYRGKKLSITLGGDPSGN